MALSILIPAKGFREGKSRLADALSAQAREALCRRLLDHVLHVAMDPALAASVHVVSPCDEVRCFAMERGATAHADRASGHVPALEAAMRMLPPHDPVLILSADLPLLTVDDLHAMIADGADAAVVVATDEAGEGSNALLMARPGLMPLRFGTGSCAAHRREAMAAGLSFHIARHPGLMADIDLPQHLKNLTIGA